MKKYFQLTILLTATVMLSGCLGSEDNTGFDPETPEIAFAENTITVGSEGGEFPLKLESNLPWRIISGATWISVSENHGMSGEEITVTVQRNRTRESRTATLTAYVTEDYTTEFTVIQNAASASESFTYYVKTDGNAEASGFSWEEATTLPTAMDLVGDGDVICLAAGTYTPVALLTGGTDEKEKTFEIHSNFTLEGGYPADAVTGAVADPAANVTTLSGNLGGGISAWHVVTVTAVPYGDASAVLKNLNITGGEGYETSEEILRSVGNSIIDAGKGGGLFIGRSNTKVINCTISGNSSCHAGGVLVYIGANAEFENCRITGNTAENNGGGIWNQGATVYMNNCTIDRNIAGQQAAGYYSIDSDGAPSVSRIYNTSISYNDNTLYNAKRSGGATYIRAGSDAVFVNCTFTGNKAGYGGVVSGHGTGAWPSKSTFISCTMTGNSAADGGGALFAYNDYADVRAYNCIVSGNTGPASSTDAGVLDGVNPSHVQVFGSILGSSLLNDEGGTVAGWTFSASGMLGSYDYYHGASTQTFPLTESDDNPAINQGMSYEELSSIASGFSPAVDSEILKTDQNGLVRSLNSIGATTLE